MRLTVFRSSTTSDKPSIRFIESLPTLSVASTLSWSNPVSWDLEITAALVHREVLLLVPSTVAQEGIHTAQSEHSSACAPWAPLGKFFCLFGWLAGWLGFETGHCFSTTGWPRNCGPIISASYTMGLQISSNIPSFVGPILKQKANLMTCLVTTKYL